MKNCAEIKDIISAYLDNKLDADQKKLFEEHIQYCENCRKELEDISQIIGMCSDVGEIELPSGFREELHARLLEESKGMHSKIKAPVFTKYAGILVSTAAVFLLAFLFRGYLTNGFFFPGKQSGSASDSVMFSVASKKSAADSAEVSESAGAMQKSIEGENNVIAQRSIAPEIAPQESGRSFNGTGRVVIDSQEEPVTNTNIELIITSPEPQTQVEKIIKAAEENGGGKAETTMMYGIAAFSAGSGNEPVIIRLKVPNQQYKAFADEINQIYGESNVKQDRIEVNDQSALINDLNNRLKEIELKIVGLEKDSPSSEELNALKQEKEDIQDQLENIRFNADYIFIAVTIQK